MFKKTIDETANHDNAMAVVDLSENANLSDPKIKDNQMVTTRYFRSLTEFDEPLEPLPIDNNMHLNYDRGFEPRCQICTSPYRERAEHIYIEEGRNAHAVVRFFAKYFSARLGWNAVDTHMQFHVNLRKTSIRGGDLYGGMGKDADLWRGNEYELALRMLLAEADSVKGMDTSRNPELKIKVSAQIERIADKLIKLKKGRDAEMSGGNINIPSVLKDIHDKMLYEEDRLIVREKAVEIMQKMQSANSV